MANKFAFDSHIPLPNKKFTFTKEKMSQIVNGFINDLSAVRDNIKLRVRVLRTWMQPLFAKPNVSNLELIVMDE